mmetsp:Transcript_40465/g.90865  ORF Transcript_40465/g.90865 Transcript_40465/m.90865 type:complete len:209 (-) Transcript_40465:34-660(-)
MPMDPLMRRARVVRDCVQELRQAALLPGQVDAGAEVRRHAREQTHHAMLRVGFIGAALSNESKVVRAQDPNLAPAARERDPNVGPHLGPCLLAFLGRVGQPGGPCLGPSAPNRAPKDACGVPLFGFGLLGRQLLGPFPVGGLGLGVLLGLHLEPPQLGPPLPVPPGHHQGLLLEPSAEQLETDARASHGGLPRGPITAPARGGSRGGS